MSGGAEVSHLIITYLLLEFKLLLIIYSACTSTCSLVDEFFFFDLKSSRLLLKKNKSADPYVQSFLVQVQLNTRDTYFRHYRKR